METPHSGHTHQTQFKRRLFAFDAFDSFSLLDADQTISPPSCLPLYSTSSHSHYSVSYFLCVSIKVFFYCHMYNM